MNKIKEFILRIKWRSFLKKKKFNFYLYQDSPGKCFVALQEALHRNGVMFERAKRRGELLTKSQWKLISYTRDLAVKQKLSMDTRNAYEMEGERCWDLVLKPLKVIAVFGYYDDMDKENPLPNYLVRESNHPALGAGSHIGAEQLTEVGLKVPSTPSYEKWVKNGRKVVRA